MLDFPASPSNGQSFTGANGAVWIYDGTKWTNGNQAALGNAIVSVSPPVGAAVGALWWDSTNGNLYVRYDDGNSLQWVAAANIPGISDTATKTDVGGALNNVGRNLLHNPLFNIAQRGAGPWTTPTGVYTLDRWALQFVSDTVTVSQISLNDTHRAAIGDEAAKSAMQFGFTGNSAAGAYSYMSQAIEDVRRLAGKVVTLSFWANATAALKVGVNAMQGFGGGGGSPSVWALTTGMSVTLATTFARYSVTFAIPSIAGKTVGTAGNDGTVLALSVSSGATNTALFGNVGVQSGTINIWGVQLEIGSQATPLEKPDPQQDLAKCQRFYTTISSFQAWGINAAAASQPFGGVWNFPVRMRSAPSIAFSSTSYANSSGITSQAPSGDCTAVYAVSAAGGNCWFVTNATASADL